MRGRGDMRRETWGGMDRGCGRQTWRGLAAHEDTSIQGSEDPVVGANGWTDQDRHGCLTQDSGVMEVGWEGLSQKLTYPHPLEGLRELETEGRTKTEPGKGGIDRQTDLRQKTDLQ